MRLAFGQAARGALRRSHRSPTQPPPYLFARIRSTDTYVISFPRSGNTWLRCLLTALVHDTTVTSELVQATVPDVHRSDCSQRSPGSWGLVKSHTPFVDIPARVVYLVRDGRDAMMSYWAHQVAVGRCDPAIGPGPFLMSPDVWPCPWREHVQGWLDGFASRPEDRSLLLRYEDLTADPIAGLARVASLAGIRASPAGLARAVRRADRDSLREAEASSGAGSLNRVAAPRPCWPENVSREDAIRFMASAGPALTQLGYSPGAS